MIKFVDDKIEHKDDDIEKIQTKPGMYMSYFGRRGAAQLVYEDVNNKIDEVINPKSPGKEIKIFIDEAENEAVISDDGRGVEFNDLELICTKLQSGSKFTREQGGRTAGENGVGLTVINALSDEFEIISTRYNQKGSVIFNKGKKVRDLEVKKINSDKHGLTVRFKPSKIFLGKDCTIDSDLILEWISKIIYMVPTDKTIYLTINKKGKESTIQKKFKNKKGFYDYIKNKCKKAIVDPVHIMNSTKLSEIVTEVTLDKKGKEEIIEREVKRFMGLEFAFTYEKGSELFIDSFCNFINTTLAGTHADAVKQGIQQFLSGATKKTLNDKEADKIDITFNDVTEGLQLALYLSTDMQPHLVGQTKDRLDNSEFFKPIRQLTYTGLTQYFREHPKELSKICDFVKINAKARIAATKAKDNVIKRTATSHIDDYMIDKFTAANNIGINEYREIYLIEGKSAKGSANQGRFDNDTQALFAFQGVPLNTFIRALAKVLDNNEFKLLVYVLRCGIGKDFDIKKLWYNKIIIMTDADVDGGNITSLICAFFFIHLRPLVEAGFLYKAITPLYRIKNKKEFVIDKKELIKIYEEEISKRFIVCHLDHSVLSDEELVEFLFNNREYLEDLDREAKHSVIHPNILEFLMIYQDDPKFEKKFAKRFPELQIDDDNIMHGIYSGKFQNLIMDKIFQKRLDKLKNRYLPLNKELFYIINEKLSDGRIEERGTMSIAEFLRLTQKLMPEIIMRYKGLGELQPAQLRNTTMDPNNRTLIQLTVDDCKRELEKFTILHGDESDERKELMRHFKISRDQLDN